MVQFTSRVAGDVEIGQDVWISFAISGGCYVQGVNEVRIGDGTIFAPGVKVISANHDPDSLNRMLPVHRLCIGKRCWIGANAVILPSVELGDDVVVGAGAVVRWSFPSAAKIAGVPARLMYSDNRDSPEDQACIGGL